MAIAANDGPARQTQDEKTGLLDMARWPLEAIVWLSVFGAVVAASLLTALLSTLGGGTLGTLLGSIILAALAASGVLWPALAPLRRLASSSPGTPPQRLSQRGIMAALRARLHTEREAERQVQATTVHSHSVVAPAGTPAASDGGADVVAEDGPARATTAALPSAHEVQEKGAGFGVSGDLQAAVIRLTSRVGQTADAMRRQAATASYSMRRMETMAVSASGVGERTVETSTVASDAVFTVESCQEALGKAQEAMATIRETTMRAARQVQVLGESAQFVRQAVVHVQDNADELHLIAGNASIEAARHPQSAGFFRSVADEIEQLAQQSQVALAEIQQAIEGNRQETGRVANVIEDVVVQVGRGAEAVSAAGGALEIIDTVVGRLAELNRAVASASQEQARDAAEVAEGMDALVVGASDAAREAAEQAALASRVNVLLEGAASQQA